MSVIFVADGVGDFGQQRCRGEVRQESLVSTICPRSIGTFHLLRISFISEGVCHRGGGQSVEEGRREEELPVLVRPVGVLEDYGRQPQGQGGAGEDGGGG